MKSSDLSCTVLLVRLGISNCQRFKNFKLFGFPVDMNTLFPFPKHKEISVIKRLFICHHFFDDKFVTSFAEML